mmetsp:Transcript_41775/g.82170  ORF Transcript_41775/g.82170 Transcript_41775/m.82170 type:complete len:267 (-) Transcript_41775:238-1038(-)
MVLLVVVANGSRRYLPCVCAQRLLRTREVSCVFGLGWWWGRCALSGGGHGNRINRVGLRACCSAPRRRVRRPSKQQQQRRQWRRCWSRRCCGEPLGPRELRRSVAAPSQRRLQRSPPNLEPRTFGDRGRGGGGVVVVVVTAAVATVVRLRRDPRPRARDLARGPCRPRPPFRLRGAPAQGSEPAAAGVEPVPGPALAPAPLGVPPFLGAHNMRGFGAHGKSGAELRRGGVRAADRSAARRSRVRRGARGEKEPLAGDQEAGRRRGG